MNKTANVRARTEPEPELESKSVFGKIRRSAAEAFGVIVHVLGVMLYRRVLYPRRIPNQETIAVLREMDAGIGVTRCENPEDLGQEPDRA